MKHRYKSQHFISFCLKECDRELASNLRWVRQIHDPTAQRYVQFVDSLRPDLRRGFGHALIRRFFSRAEAALEDDTKELIERYEVIRRQTLSPLSIPHFEFEPRLNRKARFATMVDSLRQTNPIDVEKYGTYEMRFWHKRRDGYIETFIDCGSSQYALSYGHELCDENRMRIQLGFNLLSVLGISSVATWLHIEEAEVPSIAKLLSDIVGHFITASKELDLASMN